MSKRVTKNLLSLWEKTGMSLVLALLVTGLSIWVPFFCSWTNAAGLSSSVATVGIISCTMLLCLAAGDFDLSVGSVAAMSGVLAAVVTNATDSYAGDHPDQMLRVAHWMGMSAAPDWLSVAAGIAAGVLAGGVIGLFNGFVIAYVGINALITTLGTMQIARGLAFKFGGGNAVGVYNPAFFTLGISTVHPFQLLHLSFLRPLLGSNYDNFYIPTPVVAMLITFGIFVILLNRTVFGRNALAIGGNAEAARLAGVSVVRTKIIIFTLQGLVAGFAGVIEASKFTSGQPNADYGLELDVISACVLGGVSLTGGVGTMLGVVVGVLIMGTLSDAMNLMNIDTFNQYLVRGSILITAAWIDKLKQRFSQYGLN